MLLFFTFTTVFFLAKFHNQQHQYVHPIPRFSDVELLLRSFSIDWWIWLALTGISIGCVSR
jgi:dolichyl-phosphate-mannose-protein mannosyltransferase